MGAAPDGLLSSRQWYYSNYHPWSVALPFWDDCIPGSVTPRARILPSVEFILLSFCQSSTLVVYAILGFCGQDHRLGNILSPSRDHLLPRVLVIFSWLLSLALLLFTSLANDNHFTAVSPCDNLVDKGAGAAIVYNLIFIPYVGVALALLVIIGFYGAAAARGDGTSLSVVIVGSAPFVLLCVSMVCAVIKSRHSLGRQVSTQNINKRLKFWAYWFVVHFRHVLISSPQCVLQEVIRGTLPIFALLRRVPHTYDILGRRE